MTRQELCGDIQYTEEQMAQVLGFKSVETLKNRVYAEARHPPYVEIARGVRVYLKSEYLKWALANQKSQRRKSA